MKRTTYVYAATVLAALATFSHGSEVKDDRCRPDPSSLVRLDILAKEQSSNGAVALSALKYLAEMKLGTSGYYISKSPRVRAGYQTEYDLYHESGFKKPCVVGNQSGLDGVLEVDSSTHEVKSLLFLRSATQKAPNGDVLRVDVRSRKSLAVIIHVVIEDQVRGPGPIQRVRILGRDGTEIGYRTIGDYSMFCGNVGGCSWWVEYELALSSDVARPGKVAFAYEGREYSFDIASSEGSR